MASQVFYDKALRLSFLILLASFAVSVAAAVPDGAVRIVYALDTMVAPQHQISSKRYLRSSTAMTSSDDTKTAEERSFVPDLTAAIEPGLSTFAEKLEFVSARQSALAKFNELGLNSASGDIHSNPKFGEWIDSVRKKSSESPQKSAGVIFRILSKHFGRDPAKLLVPKDLWQVLANSEFTRLKLNKLNKVTSDKLLRNRHFIEWKDFVKVSNSLENAGHETFTTLNKYYGSDRAKAVFADILKQDVPYLDFVGLYQSGDLLQNSKLIDWLSYGMAGFLTDADYYLRKAIPGHVSDDLVNLVVEQGLWQVHVNSEFTRLGLDKASGDLLENENFVKWKDFVKDIGSRESAGRETLAAMEKYYGSDRAKAVFADILKQDLTKINYVRLYRRGELFQNGEFLDWLSYGKAGFLTDEKFYLREAISGHVSDDLVNLVVEQGLRQVQVNSEFIRLGLDKASGDLLENEHFLKWKDFVRDSSSPESAGRETLAAMKTYYGSDRAKAVFADILKQDLTKIDFVRLYRRGKLLQNKEFLDGIAYGKASSPNDASEDLRIAFSGHVSDDLVNLVVEQGLRQVQVNSEFTRLGLDKASGDLLENEHFLKWKDFVKDSSSPESAGRETLAAMEKYYGSDLAKAVFAEMLGRDLPNIDLIGLYRKGEPIRNEEFLDWIAYGKASSLNYEGYDMYKALLPHMSNRRAEHLVIKGLGQVKRKRTYV